MYVEKDLGVNIDPKLDFEEQINIQTKKSKMTVWYDTSNEWGHLSKRKPLKS